MDLRLLAHAARRSDPELCGLWGLLHHAWDRVWGEDNLSLLRYLTDTYSIQCQAAGPAIWHSVLAHQPSLETLEAVHQRVPWVLSDHWQPGLFWAARQEPDILRWYLETLRPPLEEAQLEACYRQAAPESATLLLQWCPTLQPHLDLHPPEPTVLDEILQVIRRDDLPAWEQLAQTLSVSTLAEYLDAWSELCRRDESLIPWGTEIVIWCHTQGLLSETILHRLATLRHIHSLELDIWLTVHSPHHQTYSGLLGACGEVSPETLEAILPRWEGDRAQVIVQLRYLSQITPENAQVLDRWLGLSEDQVGEALRDLGRVTPLYRLWVERVGGVPTPRRGLAMEREDLLWLLDQRPLDAYEDHLASLWRRAFGLLRGDDLSPLDRVWARHPYLTGWQTAATAALRELNEVGLIRLWTWLAERGCSLESATVRACDGLPSSTLRFLQRMGVALRPRDAIQLAGEEYRYLAIDEGQPAPADDPWWKLHRGLRVSLPRPCSATGPWTISFGHSGTSSSHQVCQAESRGRLVIQQPGSSPLRVHRLDSRALAVLLPYYEGTPERLLDRVSPATLRVDSQIIQVIVDWMAEQGVVIRMATGSLDSVYLWGLQPEGWRVLGEGVCCLGAGRLAEAEQWQAQWGQKSARAVSSD